MEQKEEIRNKKEEIRKSRQRLIVILLTVGAVLAGISLLLRVLTAGKYEVQTIDLIFLVIPLLVVALAQGKLRSLDLFGLKLDFAELWSAVGQTAITDQLSDSTLLDAVDKWYEAKKGNVEDLRQLIGRQIEALKFSLGFDGYGAGAIKKYFDALLGSLRVVVVNDSEGKLFAIYNAPDLISSLRVTESEGEGYEGLAQMLRDGNEEARSKLAKLPGFIGVDKAVKENTSKQDALAKMETLNTDILPVVNEKREFVGTVGRSKLTAGLILAVTKNLEDR